MRQFLSEEQFAVIQKRVKDSGAVDMDKPLNVQSKLHNLTSKQPSLSTGSHYKGYRSKLEYNWANYLDGLKALKMIHGWKYEPFNIRLPGTKNFYKPDFMTWRDSHVAFYEIKGRNLSDDRSLVKIKTAAGLHPWAMFILVKRINGQWEERTIE